MQVLPEAGVQWLPKDQLKKKARKGEDRPLLKPGYESDMKTLNASTHRYGFFSLILANIFEISKERKELTSLMSSSILICLCSLYIIPSN